MAKPHHLSWDWRRAEELTGQQSISRTQDLPASERDHLLAAITNELSSDEFESEEARKKAAMEARIKYVDLGDGKPEVVVQSADGTTCSPTGNCAFWVFRLTENSYGALLQAEAQTFTLQRSHTHGLLDIVLARHGSAWESEVKVYKFDGKSYREGDCYSAAWEQLGSDGELHKLKEPKLIPCSAR